MDYGNGHQTPSGGSSMDSDVSDHEVTASTATMRLVDPEPHLSTQFYTFNNDSHRLMVRCLLYSRYATPHEICTAIPPTVLASWRGVWKDRNQETAYLTGWKRIQDKLTARLDDIGNEILCFKNNPAQRVPHVTQWQDIVMAHHASGSLHLSVKDTIERIKQGWTVGAKLYGVPESYIRACVASCPDCCRGGHVGSGVVAQPRPKRRRFEYTESLEVPANEVPQRLQQLAVKHKVVLCIRQKYIRYKPFMAEVKDYCCHRAGEPSNARGRQIPGVLKRKRYSSKRCGCGFRIRAIVPIRDYDQKDKSFAYVEEGKALFKLYAVHSGHEPGPHEGSARIIHRFVGPANSAIEQGTVHIVGEDGDEFGVIEREEDEEEADLVGIVAKQVEELKMVLRCLEGKIANVGQDLLLTLSNDLCAITHRLRTVDLEKGQGSEQVFFADPGGLGEWEENINRNNRVQEELIMIGNGEEEEEDVDVDFQQHNVSQCRSQTQQQRALSQPRTKISMPISRDDDSQDDQCQWPVSVKESYEAFDDDDDEKGLLVCKDTKSSICHLDSIVEDGQLVALQVDRYYQDNLKWYEGGMPCGLDS